MVYLAITDTLEGKIVALDLKFTKLSHSTQSRPHVSKIWTLYLTTVNHRLKTYYHKTSNKYVSFATNNLPISLLVASHVKNHTIPPAQRSLAHKSHGYVNRVTQTFRSLLRAHTLHWRQKTLLAEERHLR